jgi:hypothetical protein
MKARILDIDALNAVSPSALGAFVRAEGWNKIEPFADKADVYTRDQGPELLIPRHSRLGDYASVVSQVITAVSDTLGTDELAIYRDIMCAESDVVRVRAKDGVDDGAIDLEAGVKLVMQAKELLLSAACSVRSAQPFYRAGANKEASEYMRNVKLGQTEQGSFVVTMLSKVPPQIQQHLDPSWHDLEDEPMERAVTRRLMDSLSQARQAADLSLSGEAGAFESTIKSGVSANLCEAVANLIEVSDRIDVSTTWARTRPTPEQQREVKFSRDDATVFREAARIFRLREPKLGVSLFGNVTKLARDKLADNGTITIKTLVDDKPQSVTAMLDDALYGIAVAAHKKRSPIILRGDLERSGSRWQILHPSVEAVDEDEE